jgi:hypothetical protein
VEVAKNPRLLGAVKLRNPFVRMLLQTSVFAPFQGVLLRQKTFVNDEADIPGCDSITVQDRREFVHEHCYRALHTFSQLREMPQVEGPKFVFVHLLLPHPPWVFGRQGELLEPADFWGDPLTPDSLARLRSRYVDQLVFTNTKLKETIDTILGQSVREPVIILQADEGPWTKEYMDYKQGGSGPLSEETLEIRARILNAYYLPGDAAQALYPSISPVNTFRLVFNEYFNAELPLLEDRSYTSPGETPFRFTDVTDKVRYDD